MLLAVSQARGSATAHVPNIASGFGGGIAGWGATCGALVGAVMAVGLERGRAVQGGDNRAATGGAGQIYREFEKGMGSSACRQLTGLDLRTREAHQQLYDSGIHERVCVRAVSLAAQLAREALEYGDKKA